MRKDPDASSWLGMTVAFLTVLFTLMAVLMH